MMWLAAFMALLATGGEESPLPTRLQFNEPLLRAGEGAAEDGPFLQVVDREVEHLRLGLTLGAQARGSLPFGSADRGTVIVSGNTITVLNRIDYFDLLHPGFGFTLEGDLMFKPPPPQPGGPPWERTPAMGGYLAFEWDWFGGSEATDSAGTSIRPDTLKLPSILVGFKAAGTVEGNFFGDVRFGMGAAHFPSLGATFQERGGPGFRGELFAETWTFAMELRMHFGWRLGPAAFVFGFGGRLMAPPRPGQNVNFDTGALFTLDLELGAEIGF
jgi:hypothetical protein